jgi:glycosyltransferase involved in cell wall biosynthesis
MRSLVITHYGPVSGVAQNFGVYHRLSTFVRSIIEICDETEILYLVEPEYLRSGDHEALSDCWGPSVKVSLELKSQSRRWQLLAAPFSLKYHRNFSVVLAGKSQIQAIKSKLLSTTPDFVFAHRLSAMVALSTIGHLPPTFFDLDDIEHIYGFRMAMNARSVDRAIYRLSLLPTILIGEWKAIRASDKTFVCSDIDRAHLAFLRMGSKVTVIPNSIVIPGYSYPLCHELTILFLGNYEYDPNSEAAERLVSRIWPAVFEKNKSARLIIAGNRPELIPSYRSHPRNVEFPGLIDDLPALYERSRIICCPLVTGSGTRIKLIEAAAYAKPMITTTAGAEGLSFENGKEVLIHNSDRGLIAACCRLLLDDAECHALGNRAYCKARALYDIDSVRAKIKSEISGTLSGLSKK